MNIHEPFQFCRNVLSFAATDYVGLFLRKFSLYILACIKALCDKSATTDCLFVHKELVHLLLKLIVICGVIFMGASCLIVCYTVMFELSILFSEGL